MLAAMRGAIETHSAAYVAIIPLAVHVDPINEQGDVAAQLRGVQRTVEKLLLDPAVDAVVGPYDPLLIEQIRPLMNAAEIPWFLPLDLDPTQSDLQAAFRQPTAAAAQLVPLIQGVGARAAAQGVDRLIIGGWSPEERLLQELTASSVALPWVLQPDATNEIVGITARDALLWLGPPLAAVPLLAQLARDERTIPIWLGPMADTPLLPELVAARTLFDRSNLNWVTWLDSLYLDKSNRDESALEDNFELSPENAPQRERATTGAQFHCEMFDNGFTCEHAQQLAFSRSLAPTAYLTYRATQAAIAALEPDYVLSPSNWHLVHFALQPDGTSQQVAVEQS